MKWLVRKTLILIGGTLLVLVFVFAILVDWLGLPEPSWWPKAQKVMDRISAWFFEVHDRLS